MLPSVLGLRRRERNKIKLGIKWPDTLRFPQHQLAQRERRRRSTYCCIGTPPLLDYNTLYSRACACLLICALRMDSNSTCLFYLAVSGRFALGLRGERDRRRLPWQLLRWILRWKDMLLRLALAGPAGNVQNALVRSCLGCFLPNLRKRKIQAWKDSEVTRHPPLSKVPSGPAGATEEELLSTYCCSWTPPLLDCITLHARACACLYICALRN